MGAAERSESSRATAVGAASLAVPPTTEALVLEVLKAAAAVAAGGAVTW